MFEALAARVARMAERRARERARRLAEQIARDAPEGVRLETVPDGIRLTGRGPALRWIMMGLKK